MLRKATLKDCDFIYRVRNDPHLRKSFWNTREISYDKHVDFFKKNYQYYYIINENQGFVRIKDNDISIAILKKYQNKGVGKKILREIADKYPNATAQVKLDNLQSLYSFIDAGYKPVGLVLKVKRDGEK